jgi:hypothetical protein
MLMRYATADFVRALTPGAVFSWNDGATITAEVVEAGVLALSSGQVVACDPGDVNAPADCPPFVRAVPPGAYPVRLSVVTIAWPNGSQRRRVACAAVVIGAGAAVRWEPALRPVEDPAALRPGEAFAYGVDTGLGCFADGGALARLDEAAGEALYFDRLLPALGEERLSWAAVPLPGAPPATLVAFPSGVGDGFYSSSWGLDVAGEAVQLVTDFGLLTELVVEELRFPLDAWAGRGVVVAITGRVVEPEIEIDGAMVRAQEADRQGERATFRFQLARPLPAGATLRLRVVVGRRAL